MSKFFVIKAAQAALFRRVVQAFVLLAFLSSCRCDRPAEAPSLLASSEACLCPCACDAGIDATALDAGPDAVTDAPVATPIWAKRIITAGTSTLRGADGVDRLGDLLTTGWEESGSITVATRPADPTDHTQEWPREVVATGLSGIEDARLADFDGDGVTDVVACSDSGQRCYLAFGGGPTVTLTASQGHGRAMQAAAADVDADGDLDVVFGTRAGTAANPAIIGLLRNPGAMVHDGGAWTYEQISVAGWTMSVVALDFDFDGDVDVVVSDRGSYKDAAGVNRWDLYGARWLEQTATGWTNHPISPPAGSCVECTPGDEMFLKVVDWDGDGDRDIVDGTSTATKPNRIAIRINNGDGTWTQELVPAFTGVGHYQGVDVGDVDRDGRKDLVVSTWEVNALPPSPLIGVYILLSLAPGQWAFEDVSGGDGSKWDNPLFWDVDDDGWLDVVNSEQVENRGVMWFENWRTTP